MINLCKFSSLMAMKWCLLCLVFISASSTTADEPSVAVIGGGAAGLTAAYLLQKLGYKNVTVFEQLGELGGFAKSRSVDGFMFDISTVFVPGSSTDGHGIEPLLEEMIRVSGEPLVPAPPYYSLLVPSDTITALPLPITAALQAGMRKEDISQQLVDGLALHTRYFNCVRSGQPRLECAAIVEYQYDNPNENVITWAIRKGCRYYIEILGFLFESFGDTHPNASLPNIFLLDGARFWGPPEMFRVMQLLGIPLNSIPEMAKAPNLRSMYENNSTRWHVFKNGYQSFLRSLAQKANINVRLSSKVTSLQRQDNKWTLVTSSSSSGGSFSVSQRFTFDQVIVATPPAATKSILSLTEERRSAILPLLDLATAQGIPVVTALARVTKSSRHDQLGDRFGLLISDPAVRPQRNLTTGDVSFPARVRTAFCQKSHAHSDFVVIGADNYGQVPVDEVFTQIRQYARTTLGWELDSWHYINELRYPSTPPLDKLVEYEKAWSRLQGQDGLLFAGEALFGFGVPCITQSLASLMPTLFPSRLPQPLLDKDL